MAKGIKKLIAIARENVSNQIRRDAGYGNDLSQKGSFFTRGLAGEGFNGGYRAALDDIILALDGNIPQRNGWWEEEVRK